MTTKARRVDVLLYGTVLALALVGGAVGLSKGCGREAAPLSVEDPTAPSNEPRPPIVPDLPTVPDLQTEPPPPRPRPDDDPRLTELGVEMRYLSRARELLADHPAEAFGVLEEHRTRFPDGALREEREAFAIEALAALGRVEQAERRYYDFVRDYPESDFTPRLTALLR